MATATSSRPNPPAVRRNSSATPPGHHSSPSIARGATARSAATPRVPSSLNTSAPRRSPTKGPPASNAHGETRDSLSASLKQETDKKEQLLVQIQNKDQTITGLTTENDNLTSALGAAETRLNELYTEQSRMENELAQRIDVSEKLRAQIRELEKEKRDLHRRYNEQTTTFEAERQAFYDNEQHLKSRIQSLTQARKQPEPVTTETESILETDDEDGDAISQSPDQTHQAQDQDLNDPDSEPAEMTSLRLELSTLSTSYSSLQSTLVLLQTQLVDLKRVNHELQEENESYMILLRERTLNGQFDLRRQVGGTHSDDEEDDNEEENADADGSVGGSVRSSIRSTLDRVDEELPEETLEQELERSLEPQDPGSPTSSHHPRHGRPARKRGGSTSGASHGESLADLPITGPGLDLAAELGRAENKDILDGTVIDENDRSATTSKGKRGKKGSKVSATDAGGLEPSGSLNDIDALRTEVKSLKDANKALSLYASKIIDRIILQEGFEHVLANDYERQKQSPPTPSTAGPWSSTKMSPAPAPKNRPQSILVGRSVSSPAPADTRFQSPPLTATPSVPNPRQQRRSLSFDWRGFSLFNGGGEKKVDNATLRPLTLKPGTSPVTGARKLETQEDEEDKRERERLNATMKLMGIHQPPASPLLGVQKSQSESATPSLAPSSTPLTASFRRFSFFGSRSAATDHADSTSIHSSPSLAGSRVGLGIQDLTHDALTQVEAENSLAALDAHEKNLSAEIARGAGSGFTEIAPRGIGGRRSRRGTISAGGSGSGSTVWSAGMSGAGDEGDE